MQISKDENLRWTCANSASLEATHTSKPTHSWKSLLISDPKQLKHLPCSVYIYCQCIHDGARYVDNSLQWAPGDLPKYVEKRTDCNTCISQGRSHIPGYIPTKPAIPSVPIRVTAAFYDEWEKQPVEVIRTLFASQLRSPRNPQKFKQQSGTTKSKNKRSSEEAQPELAGRPLKRAKFDVEGPSLHPSPEDSYEDDEDSHEDDEDSYEDD